MDDAPPLATYHTVSEATLAEDLVPHSPPADRPEKRVKDYILLETIGKGTFGKVKLAEHCTSREKIFLVMEFAAGGDLYDFIKRNKPVSEKTCRHFFRQIISAVDYCHRNSVIHRDLKPENCLIDDYGNIKIIDFGFGNTFHRERTLDTYCGSPYYAAPEMIRGTPYVGPEVDIWSLGVILYAMLMGSLPFDHSDQSQMYSLILRGCYTPLENVSESVKDLIARMLTVDPVQRAKMHEIINHPWTNLEYPTKVDSYVTEHPAIVLTPNPDAVAELVTYGISESEVGRMLAVDCGLHPIKSLYFLVDDYLNRVHRNSYQASTVPGHTGAVHLEDSHVHNSYNLDAGYQNPPSLPSAGGYRNSRTAAIPISPPATISSPREAWMNPVYNNAHVAAATNEVIKSDVPVTCP
ncbi:protein kinase, AMP-activated, alpha 2 catalytic subunit [Phlyctochytrium bullatum]|nr:protein kinase, AMP-activated, alpha 2 catalytic subunit [Phlyctochytrium bullatum]